MRRPSLRHVEWTARISGIICLAAVLVAFPIFSSGVNQRPGLGSVWIFDVARTSGTTYTETETTSAIELCGLHVCMVYTSESSYGRTSEWITSDWVLMKTVYIDSEGNSQIDSYRDGVRLYKLPLGVGDSWIWDTVDERTTIVHEQGIPTPIVTTRDLAIYGVRKVVGQENVTVPAGRYSAFVIDHYDQNEVIRQKLWFSPVADETVKYVNGFFGIYRTVWELRRHDSNNPSLLEFFQFNAGIFKILPLLISGLTLLIAPSILRWYVRKSSVAAAGYC